MEGNDKGYEKKQENYTTEGGGKVGAVKREKTKRVIGGKRQRTQWLEGRKSCQK